MQTSQTKPWAEMTTEERVARLGDRRRWEQPYAQTKSWEDELVARLNSGKPLSKVDTREARRITRDRKPAA